jgi:hypothetical protein
MKKKWFVRQCFAITDIEIMLQAASDAGGKEIMIVPWNTAIQALVVYSIDEK